ncbi:hypothetical protein VPHD456G2_0025 [Vibrio phage D456 g2]
MKYQVEFSEITKRAIGYDQDKNQEKAIELAHRVCINEITRAEAVELLKLDLEK